MATTDTTTDPAILQQSQSAPEPVTRRKSLTANFRIVSLCTLASRVLVLADGALALECQPHDLAEKLGLQRWLRIWVAAHHKEDTLRLLHNQGFAYTPNGRSVYVKVGTSGKLAPLHLLQMASIPIEDFDLVDGELTQGESHD